MKFTKKDFVFSLITGLIAGFIAWRVLDYLRFDKPFNLSFSWLVLVVPIAWIIGVNLGYLLGRRIPAFNQFGRYAAVGFTNAAIDFGVLNLLLFYFGITAGIGYALCKAVSFIIANTSSFFWNKYWSFDAAGSKKGDREYIGFMTVSIIAGLINVGIAYFIATYVHPIGGLSENIWANVGAIVGSLVALIFSFTGYRYIFKKKTDANSLSQIQA